MSRLATRLHAGVVASSQFSPTRKLAVVAQTVWIYHVRSGSWHPLLIHLVQKCLCYLACFVIARVCGKICSSSLSTVSSSSTNSLVLLLHLSLSLSLVLFGFAFHVRKVLLLLVHCTGADFACDFSTSEPSDTHTERLHHHCAGWEHSSSHPCCGS